MNDLTEGWLPTRKKRNVLEVVMHDPPIDLGREAGQCVPVKLEPPPPPPPLTPMLPATEPAAVPRKHVRPTSAAHRAIGRIERILNDLSPDDLERVLAYLRAVK